MAWTFVGLGNPGPEYADTRHNTGRLMLEAFYKKAAKDGEVSDWKDDKKLVARKATGELSGESFVLLEPETMMNNSGKSLRDLINTSKKAEKLVVVYDDLDLPIGSIKLSFDRGSGGHRGVESIIKNIKTKAFVRIRVGASPHTPTGKIKKPQGEEKVIDHILGKWKPVEKDELKKVAKKVTEALTCLLEEGKDIAMNRYNQG